MKLSRCRNELQECEPAPAFGTVLVLAKARTRHVLHEPQSFESDSRTSRKTEEGRIPGTEIHHAEVTESQLKTCIHLETLIRVLALAEVLDLLWVASAFFARRHFADLEHAKAQRALLLRHRYAPVHLAPTLAAALDRTCSTGRSGGCAAMFRTPFHHKLDRTIPLPSSWCQGHSAHHADKLVHRRPIPGRELGTTTPAAMARRSPFDRGSHWRARGVHPTASPLRRR
jgi:hypothetical protein